MQAVPHAGRRPGVAIRGVAQVAEADALGQLNPAEQQRHGGRRPARSQAATAGFTSGYSQPPSVPAPESIRESARSVDQAVALLPAIARGPLGYASVHSVLQPIASGRAELAVSD